MEIALYCMRNIFVLVISDAQQNTSYSYNEKQKFAFSS